MMLATKAASETARQVEHYRRCGAMIVRIRISCSGIEKIASNSED